MMTMLSIRLVFVAQVAFPDDVVLKVREDVLLGEIDPVTSLRSGLGGDSRRSRLVHAGSKHRFITVFLLPLYSNDIFRSEFISDGFDQDWWHRQTLVDLYLRVMHGVDEQFGGTWESLRCPARDGLSERRCSCRRNDSFRLDWRSNRSGGWRRFAVVIVTGVDRTASSLFGGTYQFIQVGSFIVLFRSDAQTSQVALLFLKQLLEALAATSVENRWEDGVIAFLT